MAKYRVYFRDWDRNIVGRDDFDSEDDWWAILVAWTLCDACSDRCGAYGRKARQQLVSHVAAQRTAMTVDAKIQNIVLEREVALLESQWIIADSARLLQQTSHLLESTPRRSARPSEPGR